MEQTERMQEQATESVAAGESQNDASERNRDLEYDPIEDVCAFEAAQRLEEAFERFLPIYGLPSDVECFEDKRSIIETVRRVDKRKAYYWCFHDMNINEKKEVSLYAYWIMKFHPFALVDKRYECSDKAALLNESFAIYLIMGVVVGAKKLKKIKFVKDNYTGKLQYSFRYRSFSMESLMLLVESLSPKVLNKRFEVA